MADIGRLGDGGVVEYKYKVDMVRGPTDHENENNNCKHLHNLEYDGIEKLENARSDTYSLLVCSALCHSSLWNHDKLEDGLVSFPKMVSHLVIANTHSNHRNEVSQQKE